MTLIDRISKAIQRLRPAGETTARTTYERAPGGVADLYARFSTTNTRREIIEACERMYTSDTRPKAVIDRVADGAVRRGFTLSVAGDDGSQAKQAQGILDALVERTKLKRNAHVYLRRAFRHGDLFLQVVADSGPQIAGLVSMPALEMYRASNDLDGFDAPQFAYWQAARNSAYSFTLTPPASGQAGITWFADWQIIHARWDHDPGRRYGNPLLASARAAFKRYREGEIDMAVRRKTRAGLKFLHRLKSDQVDAIEKYKHENRDVLNNPFAAVADLYVNGDADISVLQGDARLNELGDVLHHLDAFFVVSPLPMALAGYGKDINRDVLRDQYAAYLRSLDETAEWFEHQVLRPIFETELLLHGIFPASVTVTVQWAEKNELPFSVEDWTKLAASGRLTDETMLKLLCKVLPEFDAEAEIKALEALAKDANLRVPGDAEAMLQMLRDQANGGKAQTEPASADLVPTANGKGVT